VVGIFRAAIVSALCNGESMLFWIDNWLQGTSICCLAPAVFAAVPKRRRCVSVAEALHGRACMGASHHWAVHYETAHGVYWPLEHGGAGAAASGCTGHFCLEAYGRSLVFGVLGLWSDVRRLLQTSRRKATLENCCTTARQVLLMACYAW
jgi:hypothetical protein